MIWIAGEARKWKSDARKLRRQEKAESMNDEKKSTHSWRRPGRPAPPTARGDERAGSRSTEPSGGEWGWRASGAALKAPASACPALLHAKTTASLHTHSLPGCGPPPPPLHCRGSLKNLWEEYVRHFIPIVFCVVKSHRRTMRLLCFWPPAKI